ncbi:MAG: glycosyltransferase family protein [Bacteroidota bacterium]
MKRILYAVLDWGLGHATRSMVLIDYLVQCGVEVHLASSGSAAVLLRQTFPQLPFLPLPPYQISYSKGLAQVWHLTKQVPAMLHTIQQEHQALQTYLQKVPISGIISDHRYGIWDSQLPSVFVGHQLALILPPALEIFRKGLYRYHMHWLRHFDQIWIPDVEGEENLSGKLTHEFALPSRAKFVGPLSRFMLGSEKKKHKSTQEVDVLAILSGPEPQRTLLEQKIRQAFSTMHGKKILIQGKPASQKSEESQNLKVFPHLPHADFLELLSQTPVVISRSGYSSIMDYAYLGLQNIICVPTPGQTEQEYLGRYLHEKQAILTVSQSSLKLSEAILEVENYQGFDSMDRKEMYQPVLDDFLSTI